MKLPPLLARAKDWLRVREERKAEAALADLKVRYHTFRILLANNERALEQICALDSALRSSQIEAAAASAAQLLDTLYDLVEGVNILDGRQGALFGVLSGLGDQVRETLEHLDAPREDAPVRLDLSAPSAVLDHLAGGKASSLARLVRAGLPVPRGIVMTTEACRLFLHDAGLEEAVRQRLRESQAGKRPMEEVLAGLEEEILRTPLSEELSGELRATFAALAGNGGAISARSSARVEDRPGQSFAGQFVSCLNITSPALLEDAYRRVVAGNFSARATSYRLQAGLPAVDMGMAVLCQRMVQARAAGVLYTVDPTNPASGRMLVSAGAGLGTQVVDGAAAVDTYRPCRLLDENSAATSDPLDGAIIARKETRAVSDEMGGLKLEPVPEAERSLPLLTPEQVERLAALGRLVESMAGEPQDIEWALDGQDRLFLLQARSVPLPKEGRRIAEGVGGKRLAKGGTTASPGRAVGRAAVLHSAAEIDGLTASPSEPRILVMGQSLVDAARLLPASAGVAVEFGNPTDHLSCVARETGIPMLTGVMGLLGSITSGDWIVLDADRGEILSVAAQAVAGLAELAPPKAAPAPSSQTSTSPVAARLHDLVVPLNLTDAYGPAFSIAECASLHDIVRYCHEKAVLAMFEAGDAALEEASSIVRRLSEGLPLHFLIIDLGGGLAPGRGGLSVPFSEVLSHPLRALCEGVSTPGLRWNAPPPGASVSGLITKGLLDNRGPRPLGNLNYALVTRDYLNLNARVEFHFAMIDSVCGRNPRENYVRFRFKGGGMDLVRRERRARCVAAILEANDFYTKVEGDLVTASLHDLPHATCRDRLIMLGRLLGFTRLLDSAMTGEDMPARLAQAFMEGNYALEGFGNEKNAV